LESPDEDAVGEESDGDDEAAHGRGALLDLVALGGVLAYRLARFQPDEKQVDRVGEDGGDSERDPGGGWDEEEVGRVEHG